VRREAEFHRPHVIDVAYETEHNRPHAGIALSRAQEQKVSGKNVPAAVRAAAAKAYPAVLRTLGCLHFITVKTESPGARMLDNDPSDSTRMHTGAHNSGIVRKMNWPRTLLTLTIAIGLQQHSFAQEQSGIAGFTKEFVQDQRGLWTSPLRVERRDVKWLLPLGLGTAAFLITDRSISGEAQETDDVRGPSRIISTAGSYPLFVTPLTLLAVGRLSHSARTTQAGTVGLQAVLQSTVIVQALKASTNRERPDKNNGSGGFWDGGKSFPSGHAMTTWAFASAMADQYADKKWIGITGYSVATAVSLARIGGLNHFPSDVLVGSSIGWLVGHCVSHHHRQ